VTVVEPNPTPLYAALGPEMGGFFAELHRRNGVDIRVGTSVTGFRGTERVSAVTTEGGGDIPADAVIVGIGARPSTELAEHAGLAVDNGIVVDRSLRTDDPDVYGGGRRELVQSLLRQADPRRALGERPQRGTGRRQGDAGRTRRL
jgi:3-phenylpropionate/trans-cinnamate dioxygenase ferredoxin reductase subunit